VVPSFCISVSDISLKSNLLGWGTGDSIGRFGILSKRVDGERKAPVKKRKAAKEEDFEEQNSTAFDACEYRDGGPNKVSTL
jgi:hypothetical protein